MKALYFFLLFILGISIGVTAQNWALPSSKWRYEGYSAWSATIYSEARDVTGDTVLGGQHCTVVSAPYHYPVYTYASGDTAYRWVNGVFHPMFYFNAHAGDTIMIGNDTAECCAHVAEVRCRVDSEGIIVVGGLSLKKFSVRVVDSLAGHAFPPSFEYAERIGILGSYSETFYQPFTSALDADSYGFCNYGDSTIAGFWLYPHTNCRNTVGLNDVAADALFSIYPNPAQDILYIQSHLVLDAKVNITDMTGRELTMMHQDSKIDIRLLAPGIYTICITTPDGKRSLRFKKD